jgi:flagellar hook-associated protein 1 FlgK
MGEAAQRIADAATMLDTLATEFVEGVNAFQAAGHDLAGESGEPMFDSGGRAAQITLSLTDPRGIAAAAVDGGTRDNANLAALDTLRSAGRFEARVTETVTANASALSSRRLIGDAQAAMYQTAVAARASETGVNVDEEAVDLLRFQQAYQASSRVIQIARETLQAILDIR